jgi:hypothetical protein
VLGRAAAAARFCAKRLRRDRLASQAPRNIYKICNEEPHALRHLQIL